MAFIFTLRERAESWAGRERVTRVHRTRAEAVMALVDYARRNWGAEMHEEPPADEEELVERYFEDVLEVYEITEIAGYTSY